VRVAAFDPRNWLRLVSCILRQHQRQDFRNVLDVAGAIKTVIVNCQAREHGHLPRDHPRMPSHDRILASSVRLSTMPLVGILLLLVPSRSSGSQFWIGGLEQETAVASSANPAPVWNQLPRFFEIIVRLKTLLHAFSKLDQSRRYGSVPSRQQPESVISISLDFHC
jgi:hypothetical protein